MLHSSTQFNSNIYNMIYIKPISTCGWKHYWHYWLLTGGLMPATMGPYPALNLPCKQHPHPMAALLCHCPTAGFGARASPAARSVFQLGTPYCMSPRHMEGKQQRKDPCWGTQRKGEILTVVAVSVCAWCGPWLLGWEQTTSMAQHSSIHEWSAAWMSCCIRFIDMVSNWPDPKDRSNQLNKLFLWNQLRKWCFSGRLCSLPCAF